MTTSEDLTWRGLIKDKTFGDSSWLDTPRSFYLGIDASADSLTVGNLAIILLARRLKQAGWQAVIVMGGGTSLVGDPGGKTEERQLISREVVEANITAIKSQVSKLFSGQNFVMVDNYDWLSELKYVDFLRDVGKHFSMTELMQRDFVVERMNEGSAGISYAEFSYSLVQGYDFWHLFKNNDVVMQIGGSDQWGNMLSGVALIRKKEAKDAQALSIPLVINKATGVKFGKSEEGAIWLDATKTTPTKFYQFWVNTDDSDVEDYLKLFTMLSKEEISEVVAAHHANPPAHIGPTKLAEEVTRIVHGEPALKNTERATHYLTGQMLISDATSEDVATLKREIPSVNSLNNGSVIDALVKANLATSNTEARRLLADGAISLNAQKLSRENFEPGDFKNGRLLLRRGKAYKDSALVEL